MSKKSKFYARIGLWLAAVAAAGGAAALGVGCDATHHESANPATGGSASSASVHTSAAPAQKGGGIKTADRQAGVHRIKHVIVVYQENWSFDGLYGSLPGADGLADAAGAPPQVSLSGVPLAFAPQPIGPNGLPDPRFPAAMPVTPYNLLTYLTPNDITGDIVHRFYQEQVQIDGGRMDKFVAESNNGGLVMSYFDASSLPEGMLARQYTTCDHFFHSAFGGSYLNHIFLIAAAPPVFPNAPASMVAVLDANGNLLHDGAVSPDGYGINTSFSVNHPHPAGVPAANLVPDQTMPTIGDSLSARNVSWAWYSGGWNNALAGNPDPTFQFHHQPFIYFQNYADGTAAKAAHLKDEQDFYTALQNGTLPSVSFVKFLGIDNEHPGYATLFLGQQHVADLVQQVQNSAYWDDTAIFVTYDENGGRWDHVSPFVRDRWGPGSRVPTIVISRFAKRGFVDDTVYDTSSILKFIENRWNLDPLNNRDGNAPNIVNPFDFDQGNG